MPTVYQATMDGSDAIIFNHIQLVSFYLQCARDYKQDLENNKVELWLKPTISLIMFSTMALEAFINELAEELVEASDRESFDRCQKSFQKPKAPKQSSVRFKFSKLIEKKYSKCMPDNLGEEIEFVIDLRNTLVHYKLSETAGRYYVDPPKNTKLSDGRGMLTIDFTKPIKHYQPAFLEKISVEAGLNAYKIVYACLTHWFELAENSSQLRELEAFKP